MPRAGGPRKKDCVFPVTRPTLKLFSFSFLIFFCKMCKILQTFRGFLLKLREITYFSELTSFWSLSTLEKAISLISPSQIDEKKFSEPSDPTFWRKNKNKKKYFADRPTLLFLAHVTGNALSFFGLTDCKRESLKQMN